MRNFNPWGSPETESFLEHRHDVLRHVPRGTFSVKFDRSVQAGAKNNKNQSDQAASGFGAQATQIGSSLIPGLERQANNPTGLTPMQKNAALVSGAEAAGGVESGGKGAAMLQTLRTKTPGGFGAALAEAARVKGRQLSSNALGVENEDARMAQENQARAQSMLSGLYGTDTSNQLKAMGLSDEALNTQLAGGKSGWLQNAEGLVETAADAAKAFKK